LPRNSATVNTYRPAAPEGGGYPVARTAPGERVTEISLPARQMAEADANYRASSGVVPSTDDLISRINAMADSLKLFESGAITGTQQFWARYAEALGNPAIARAIMNGDPAGTEWLAKNTVQGVLEQLSAMKPNFAQREFSATLDKGTPTIDLLPRANFAILTEQLARASRMRAWETDWQKAQSEGWESPSAFFEAWSRANPVDVFKQAASRSIGNIRGTSLPSANDLVPGQVYVMPQNADQRTRNLFGGVGPNQVFRFNGFGRPIDVISPEDLMLRRTP
jgi:hypothetical protein